MKQLNLVYTVGRVGSTSVYKMLVFNKYPNCYQIHFLDKDTWQFHIQRSGDKIPKHLRDAIKAHHQMETEQCEVNIITGVREPVRRTLSSLYHNNRAIRTLTREDFIHSINFFERELWKTMHINIYGFKFDRRIGYAIYRFPRRNINILVYRQENLEKNLTRMLNKFYGRNHKRTLAWNVERNPDYLQDVLHYKCPFLDELYASQYMRHFYTQAEISGFREVWQP